MREVRWLGGAVAATVIVAACGDVGQPTGPAPSDDALLIGPMQIEVDIHNIYSGDPPAPDFTINLNHDWVYVEILDVEEHIPTPNVIAGDVRIGDDWATGVPAESFEILDINNDGNRDIRLRWDLEELEAAGHLPIGPEVTINVWGVNPVTGLEYSAEAEVQVIVPETCEDFNGPFITHPGGGTGIIAGADVSMSSPAPHNAAGSNVRFAPPAGPHFRLADDFQFTLALSCPLNRIITYGYETGSATPLWTQANINVREGSVTGPIVATATTTEWVFTGVYRTFNGVLNNADRPIHAIHFEFENVELDPGTYWIDWQVEGGTSGWGNFVMLPDPVTPGGNNTITVFDNGQQMTVGGVWQPTLDPPGAEIPFHVNGPAPQAERPVPVRSGGFQPPARYAAQPIDAAQ